MLPGHDLPFGRMLHWIALGDRLLGRRETTGFNDRAEVLDEAEKCPVLGRVEFGGSKRVEGAAHAGSNKARLVGETGFEPAAP